MSKINIDNLIKEQENKKINGTIQTYDILLKANVEENKQLKEELELSKKQNNDERYEYLCKKFNTVDYAIKLEKYTIKLLRKNKQIKENYDRIYNENCKLREEHNINDISLLDENQKLKDNWNKLKEWVNKYYDYYTNEKDYIGGRLCFIDMKNKMQEIGEVSDEKR